MPAANPGATAPPTATSDNGATASGPDATASAPTVATEPGEAGGGDDAAMVVRTSDAASAATDAAGGATADAQVTTMPALPDAGSVAIAGDAGTPPTSAFTCTLLIGIQATEEWYIAGFETMVDNSKWELIWVHSGFVELWANASDPIWQTAITSPCTQNSTRPDRVIFVALNYIETTSTFWTPTMTSAVANIQAKYPSVKRIELMTFIRAPGNMACSQAPAPRSTITPAQDQAADIVAAANPGLVFVAPKFEVKSCNEYSNNPPHPSAAGATAWATMMANYYR